MHWTLWDFWRFGITFDPWLYVRTNEPQRKTAYFLTCAPNKDSVQAVHPCSLIKVSVVHLKKLCILDFPKLAQWRFLIRLRECAGWSESSLGAYVRRCIFWHVVVSFQLKLPPNCIKACVLIENVLAAFQMEEILYELRDRSIGLNCGLWDYSASFINKFGKFMLLYIGHFFIFWFVLRFYGPINPMASCRAQSIYLITRLLGRLSPLYPVNQYIVFRAISEEMNAYCMNTVNPQWLKHRWLDSGWLKLAFAFLGIVSTAQEN